MKWRSFKEARKFVRSLKLKNREEWRKYSKSGKRPADIPAGPDLFYKEEWKGMGDWLGTGTLSNRNLSFRSFSDARKFVRKLGLKHDGEWRQYCKSGKKPDDIPTNPNRTYKKEWISMGDWLGTGTIASQKIRKNMLSYAEAQIEAKKICAELKIDLQDDWNKAWDEGKIPKNLPRNPWEFYSELQMSGRKGKKKK